MSKRKIYNTEIELRQMIRNYLGNKCIYCGAEKRLEIHHIIPLSKGGINSLGNVELVCKKCHLKLHKQLAKIFPNKNSIIR